MKREGKGVIECVYWTKDEWTKRHDDVMGAIMGAITAIVRGTFGQGYTGDGR